MKYCGIMLTIATILNSVAIVLIGWPNCSTFAASALGICVGVLTLAITHKDRT